MGQGKRTQDDDAIIVTPAASLKLAPAMPEVERSSQQGGADIRAGGKISATPSDRGGNIGRAIFKFSPEQQQTLVDAEPYIFSPLQNAWEVKGWPQKTVRRADVATAKSALWLAWTNVAPRKLVKALAPQ